MGWFDEQRKDYQKAPPRQSNPAADIGKMAPPPQPDAPGVSVTDLGNTDTGMGGEVPERPNDPAYMAIWRQAAAGLKRGGFPATESRNYWTKRILETSGTVDDYWTRRMQAGPSGQAAFHGGGGEFGGGTIGDLTAPFTEQFTAGAPYPGFRPPSGDDLLRDDPGYTFRLGQGQKALEQSAASRGVLNTGGTLKDILGYGQSLASQEYKGAYDRALGQYQTNYRTQFSDPEDARYRDYLTRYNVFRTNQSDPFSRYLSVAQLGANATA